MYIQNSIERKGILRDEFSAAHVMDDIEQVETSNAVGFGSLILITSRDKDLFSIWRLEQFN